MLRSCTLEITQQALESKISEQFSSMSKRLQQVARYFLDNPNNIAFGTVASIAKEAGVHASTLVRFANALEFSGFSQMQAVYKQHLISNKSDYQTRIKAVQSDKSVTNENSTGSWFRQISELNIQAITEAQNNINEVQLNKAVSILSSANVVHIQGVRRAFPAATYITYMLSNLGRPTYLLDGVGNMFTAQHSMFQQNDVLFAISFYPYAQETQVAVQSAIENGCKVIVLTDSVVSPLCEHADIYFAVKEAELHAFRSLNNSMNLIQAIVLSLINQYPME